MEWLFDICCKILSGLGSLLGLSYKEICVIGNIHIQGGIWLLSAMIPFIVLMQHKQTSMIRKTYLILAIGYGFIHSILFIMFCGRYSFPIMPIALKRYHRSVVSGTIIALRAVPPVSL